MTLSNQSDVADVLKSTAEDGEIRCTLGSSLTEFGLGDAPVWGMDGFISRPNDPDADGACQAFYLADPEKRILAFYDPRFSDAVGSLDPGDRAIVTDGAARIFLKKARDAVVLYTESQPDDLSMMFDMSGEDGTLTIVIGNMYLKLGKDGDKKDVISLGINGGASLTLYADGTVRIDGKSFQCNTPSGQLGYTGSPDVILPIPLNSILAGATGVAAKPSTGWTVSV